MLTSKSNFNTLRDLKDKPVTDEMLKQLYDNCTSKDFINLNGNLSKGYPSEISTFIMQKIDVTKEDKIKILVFNDLSFHMYNRLTNAGILQKNITLAFGKWNKDGTVSDDKKVYNIMSMFAKSNFIEFERDASNIVTLEELFNMKNTITFDYIISNPPYEIGNIITKSIIDNTQFDHFIDLEPISNFRANKLYQHIKSIQIIPCLDRTFDDAATNPHIYTLSKDADKSKTWEQIQLETYDKKWRKYYEEQLKREASWETAWLLSKENCLKLNRDITFALTVRTFVDGVHKTRDCFDYIYNCSNEDITEHESIKENKNGGVMIPWSIFKTALEKQNISNFWYNSKIMSEIAKGFNKQSLSNTSVLLPKVDWSRPWTDEQILEDYGYTKEEIDEILNETNRTS